MGNIGDSISDTAPAVGTSGPGYATTINSLLTELRARLISRIPLSSLLVSSNLDMNGQALLNLAYVTMANAASTPGASPVNRLVAYQGNIWWVSPSGAVQLTNGASLNAAGIGGITGDYSGAGPMEFRYDLANTRYDAFANQSTNTWAYIRARGFDIAGGATSAFRQRHIYTGTSNTQLTWTEGAANEGPLKVNGSGEIATGAVDQFEQTSHPSKYLVIPATELFTRGVFSGSGVGAIAETDDVFRYNLSLAGGIVDIHVRIDNEGSTVLPNNPITVKGIYWKGLINGGGYPTLEIFKHQSESNTFDTDPLEAVSQTLGAIVTASGAVQTASHAVVTPFTLTGDEFMSVRLTAGTNNLDTYYVIVEYDKQS